MLSFDAVAHVGPRHWPERANKRTLATKAIIFDCDGLLVDSEPVWREAEMRTLVQLGVTWPHHFVFPVHGLSLEQAAGVLIRELSLSQDVPALTKRMTGTYLELVDQGMVHTIPGAASLLDELYGRLPLAVASNSSPEVLSRVLEKANLRYYFKHAQGLLNDMEPKPKPDVYLAACRAISTDPSVSWAVEDSASGIAAARAAGLRVIAVSLESGLDANQQVCTLRDLNSRSFGI